MLLLPRPERASAQSRGLAERQFEHESPMRERPQKVFYVYIMASKPRGVLYVAFALKLRKQKPA